MDDYYHSLEFLPESCTGCMACMRVCPTYAIRMKNGKAKMISERCVDCGECIKVCTSDAILALTDPFSRFKAHKYRVAVPSSVLYAQFAIDIPPAQILYGLKKIGFDDVYDISSTRESLTVATQEYLKDYEGPRPLISSTCPAVVRLIQVSYPCLTEQITPIEVPREVAARELKQKFCGERGIDPESIEAIYITPCPAKMISIRQPAEKERSSLDGAVAISDIYNSLLSVIVKEGRESCPTDRDLNTSIGMSWAVVGGESESLRAERCLSVSGLNDVVQVLEDLESGKLRDVDFLECYSCPGGCISGSLTVANPYVARSKVIRSLRKAKPRRSSKEVLKLYKEGFFFMEARIQPRPLRGLDQDVAIAVKKKKKKDQTYELLPKIDCGLCGCPTCLVFAEDVAVGEAEIGDCVFMSTGSLAQLTHAYQEKMRQSVAIGKARQGRRRGSGDPEA